jgi:hypothetical protein
MSTKAPTFSRRREVSLAERDALRKKSQSAAKRAAALAYQVIEHERAHMREFPLTPQVMDQLATMVGRGEALCCEAGRDRLRPLVDPLWADAINAWAYEHLSCKTHGNRDEELASFKAKLTVAFYDGSIIKEWGR